MTSPNSYGLPLGAVAGVYVSGSVIATGPGPVQNEAALWTAAGGIVPLGFLPGASGFSYSWALSADGSVVVGESYDTNFNTQAFLWTATTGMVGLGFLPGGSISQAFDVSADGPVVVGSAGEPSGPNEQTGHAFRWSQATGMVALPALAGSNASQAYAVSSDGSVVAGIAVFGSPPGAQVMEAVEWRGNTVTPLGFLPGDSQSQANAVSADGSVVVGYSLTGTSAHEAFRWTETGGMVGLGFLPGTTISDAFAVNSDGSVVVGICEGGADGGGTSFRWTLATGIQSIPLMLNQVGEGNISIGSPRGISADGTVIIGTNWYAQIPVDAFGLLDLAGADHSLGSLLWGGTVINSGPYAATLTVGSDNTDTVFSGSIEDGGSGSGVFETALNKIGTGKLALTGISTYSGGTTISSGTLELGNAGAAGYAPITFAANSNAMLRVDGQVMPANTFLGFALGDSIDLRDATLIAGSNATLNSGSPPAPIPLVAPGSSAIAMEP
jgi:probable HAF family extracellular repeat protein/autotransporter-associated beta strand protein